MGASSTAITFNGSVVDLVQIKVTKGNELTDIVTETFDGADFAASEYVKAEGWEQAVTASTKALPISRHGMAMGREAGKAVRISKQIAALGARGDYIDIILSLTTGSGTSSYANLVRNVMVDALDYSGVPVAVQHAIFGKFSPFVTPTQPVSRGMIQGIDRQQIEMIHNVVTAVAGTAVNQKIRGTATSKLTATVTGAATAETQLKLTMKPGGDGVYVIPRGAVIWAGAGLASTKTLTLTVA